MWKQSDIGWRSTLLTARSSVVRKMAARMTNALKAKGVLYFSFKHGDAERRVALVMRFSLRLLNTVFLPNPGISWLKPFNTLSIGIP